ncbi:hypothetical protein KIH39_25930 [Telmatocola sphagniphila]|uniref:Uncharacterized protein n=1 Tax=Telmatocola sphagniphila TaxID=1123043 RepID=A0A8E6B5F2_9BACT|nr:hypothetical protein [Telmatocola sphagniphila]QVL32232.1 hypothetical protein KIH39_25930 [Telmatocola sphagniphila]
MKEGCTPLEVLAILSLNDYDLAVRCLEVVKLKLHSILPANIGYRIELIPLCHHQPDNYYPALGVFGPHSLKDAEMADRLINAWVDQQGIDWLIAQTTSLECPTWESLKNSGM